MSRQRELEARINEAWERGDTATLARLQEQFRSGV